MSILNFIILYSDRIIISKNIDVIRPFIIEMVIIKDTGQSIFINWKYPIMPNYQYNNLISTAMYF